LEILLFVYEEGQICDAHHCCGRSLGGKQA
jgi:hypothetical protein